MSSSGNNQEIEILVNAYLQVSSTPTNKLDELANNIVNLMIQALPSEVVPSKKSLNIPYKDISDTIFSTDERLLSNGITEFHLKIQEAVSQHTHCTRQKTTSKQNEYKNRVMDCHYKVVEHILLAQTQRKFINESIEMAVQKQLDSITNIQEIANTAERTAKKAEETYKSMFANYVTILGVFTAIIVTIFGGLNVINVVAKQAQADFGLLLFLTAMSVLCIITLLYFLANMIAWLTKSQQKQLSGLFYSVIAVCATVMIAGFCLMHYHDKNKPAQKQEPLKSSTSGA